MDEPSPHWTSSPGTSCRLICWRFGAVPDAPWFSSPIRSMRPRFWRAASCLMTPTTRADRPGDRLESDAGTGNAAGPQPMPRWWPKSPRHGGSAPMKWAPAAVSALLALALWEARGAAVARCPVYHIAGADRDRRRFPGRSVGAAASTGLDPVRDLRSTRSWRPCWGRRWQWRCRRAGWHRRRSSHGQWHCR